jgi:hypothetical protein
LSRAELVAKCLRSFKRTPETREIERIEIVRLSPAGSGPNWTFGMLEPPPTAIGYETARAIVAEIAGNYALASD